MNFTIRSGEKQDMEAVLELITELAIFEKEPNAVAISVDDLIKNGFKENPAFHTFVAVFKNKIVGMALFYNRFSTWKGPSIHLEDLIVMQNFRGSGIGRALYDKVLDYALKKEVKRVEWAVLDWNTPAINFYKSTGAILLDDWKVCQITNKNIQQYLSKK